MPVSPEREAAIRLAHAHYAANEDLCVRDGFCAVDDLLALLDYERRQVEYLSGEGRILRGEYDRLREQFAAMMFDNGRRPGDGGREAFPVQGTDFMSPPGRPLTELQHESEPERCRSVRTKGRCELAAGHDGWHLTRVGDYTWKYDRLGQDAPTEAGVYAAIRREREADDA